MEDSGASQRLLVGRAFLGRAHLRETLRLWAIGFTLSLFLLWSTTTSVDKPVGYLVDVSTLFGTQT